MNSNDLKICEFAFAVLGLLFSCTINEEQSPVIEVDSISIVQNDLTIEEGESMSLSAVVLPQDAKNKTIKWSSSDESKVKVSSDGRIDAMAIGSAVITAEAGKKKDFITVTVVARVISVTGVSLSPSSLTIKVGQSQTIEAKISPEDATIKNISWLSSNPDIATVDNGTVSGISAGTVAIIATTEDGGKTAECSVKVKLNLSPTITLGASHITAISAVLSGEANLDNERAADNNMGFLISTEPEVALSNSTKIVVAEINEKEGYEDSYIYSVIATPLEPSTTYYFRSFVNQNNEELYGEIKEFSTEGVGSLIETLDASSIEASDAVLNARINLENVQHSSLEYGFYYGLTESALNTAIKGGDIKDNSFATTLTNLSHNTQYWYKAYVTLDSQTLCGEVKSFTTNVVPVQSVSLDRSEYTFKAINDGLLLTATILPSDATDQSVSWSSDNEDVVTVDNMGRLCSTGNGTATITVTTNDQNKTAKCIITVAQQVTSIKLNNSSLSISEGKTANLTVTEILPSNAFDKSYSWSSSNNAVATVDSSGKVTAKTKGTAIIKVVANDGSGVSASCEVTVIRLVTDITFEKEYVTVGCNKMVLLKYTVTPSDASITQVSWNSSDTYIASISDDAWLRGWNIGHVTITATAKDGSGVYATCEVDVLQYVSNIIFDKYELSIGVGEEYTLTTTILPENANVKTISWSSSDSSVAAVDDNGKITGVSVGTATIKASANDGSGTYKECNVIVVKLPDVVDMGNAGKWASFNLGASEPEQYGDYYAWAEIEPYYKPGYSQSSNPQWKSGKSAGYAWASYRWCNGSRETLTKYNRDSSLGTVDNKDDFSDYQYEDDPARQKLGGKWRTPTDWDWARLLANCTWKWTTQNGVYGYKVTAKNGNSIFLPAAGHWSDKKLTSKGQDICYWSNQLYNPGPSAAWGLIITAFPYSDPSDVSGSTYDLLSHNARYWGMSIRPFYDAK